MSPDFIKVAQAIRVETDTQTGKVLVVFEVTHPLFRKKVKEAWAENVNCYLIMEENEKESK